VPARALRRWARRAAAALAALGVVALPLAGPTLAQQEAPTVDELGLEVQSGFGGRRVDAPWTPVEVAVEPTRLLAGELAVTSRSNSGLVTEVRDIEATAGTRRVFRFLVPTGAISVRVTEQGRAPVEVRARAAEGERGYLVGALGGVPDGAPALRDEPTGLQGTWVPVDPGWLELSPDAVEGLSALVVPASAIADLSETARFALGSATGAGLELLVISDGPARLEGLAIPGPVHAMSPAGNGGTAVLEPVASAWVTTAEQVGGAEGDASPVAARLSVGQGGVTVLGAGPGAEGFGRDAAFWSGLTGPRPGIGAERGEWAVDEMPYQFARLFSSAGSSAPTLPWLAAFTAAYVIVVGPVNGFLLSRMRRRELAWVTVPIVTVVFTAGAFFGIAGGQTTEGPAARLLVAVDGATTEHVVAGVRAATGGSREVVLPGEGWRTRLLGSQEAVLRRGADVRATLQLAPLELGGVVATRPIATAPPLTVTASAGAAGVDVVVRNTGGTPMEGVAVRAATAMASVGTLEPGEEREVTIERTALPSVSAYRDVFEGLSMGAPRSLEALLRDRVIDGNPGVVWAVGTLANGSPELRVDGARPQDRGLLVAVGTTPTSAGGAVSPFAVQRDVTTSQRRVFRPSPLALEGPEEAFLRFRLPGDGEVEILRAQLRGLGAQVSVWEPAARAWQPVGEVLGDGPDGGDPERLVDAFGVVHVRVEGELFPLDFSALSIDGIDEGSTR
jgi:hypothetical protein